MRFCYVLAIGIMGSVISAENSLADDMCESDAQYSEKRAECSAKGSEFVLRNLYSDGCECIQLEPTMTEDLGVAPDPVFEQPGEGGGE